VARFIEYDDAFQASLFTQWVKHLEGFVRPLSLMQGGLL